MNIVTAEQMRAIDHAAIHTLGIPGLCLMEAAGIALARACAPLGARRITLVCGTGSNGGDGFVAARHLDETSAQVTVALLGDVDRLTGDAAVQFRALRSTKIPIVDAGAADFTAADLLVDCLLGTGASGAPRPEMAAVIERMNAAPAPIVACDLPTGVDADSGQVPGTAIRATATLALAALKPGLLLYPGATFAGTVSIASIGLPKALFSTPWATRMQQAQMVALLPPRSQSRDANKGSFGKLLVIAGGFGMAGAAVLCARSALRSGAGLVTLALPRSLVPIAATLAPELVLKALPETADGFHGGEGAAAATLELAARCDAVALGPGLGAAGASVAFVERICRTIERPLVIDADGLNAVARSGARCPPGTVLTPHPGEMGTLLGRTVAQVQADRVGAVRAAAEQRDATVLLKGARTLVAAPDGRLGFNRLGSVALGTAGSGDVLTGLIGALLAAGLSAFDAARAGAYLHALAGERCEAEIGAVGTLAGDIAQRLPEARRMLYERESQDETL